MTRLTTKSLSRIEQQMEASSGDPLRRRMLECAKNFKTSWIDLGQSLYAVWKDRLYKEWGYMTFEAYTAKEIGIKKQTAMKLLKSYYFLEKEEPVLLEKERSEDANVAAVPSYESVNLLRLAKGKKAIDEDDYRALKRDVFQGGKDAGDVRKCLTGMIKQRRELDPEEARQARRTASLKRIIATLKALRTEAESSKMLPQAILKETSQLIAKLEAELG